MDIGPVNAPPRTRVAPAAAALPEAQHGHFASLLRWYAHVGAVADPGALFPRARVEKPRLRVPPPTAAAPKDKAADQAPAAAVAAAARAPAAATAATEPAAAGGSKKDKKKAEKAAAKAAGGSAGAPATPAASSEPDADSGISALLGPAASAAALLGPAASAAALSASIIMSVPDIVGAAGEGRERGWSG